ncbi:hypothetical protein GDO78_003762 [Eleutherodactylus coqui]|uniref:Uncharacterized protein n=1 Tax=Eleutherodactylus coqui TaxID=57060 RepID=A0A8J6EV73_ELECQ|nr:hypothetical protein GDO78_003762 [Eleutherodactylus coqui]
MTFANLLDRIGGVGTFQILHSLLLAFPVCMVACHNFLQNFTAAFPAHHCEPKPGLNGMEGLSYQDLLRVTVPTDERGLPARCQRFKEPQWSFLNFNGTLANITEIETEPCVDGWVYDKSVIRSSIITEVRFHVVMLEWMPVKGRTLAGTFIGYVFTSGQMVLSGLAYAIRDWRWLQFSVTAPFYLFFIYSWFLQESGRWLILNGKTDQALTNLRRVAKMNGKLEEGLKLTKEEVISQMQNEISNRKSSHTILDLIRTPGMRRITGCLMMVWFSTSFAYYGLAMDLQKFGISIYLVQFCFGAIDVPAKFVAALTMSYIGRRVTQGTFLILAGSMIIANIFVPIDMRALRTALAALGKGFCASAFMCAYLYSGELFPTEIRQTGMGFSDMNARVGSVVAPVIHLIGDHIPILPAVIFGTAPVLSGIAAICLLTETRNRPLLDTIKEVEEKRLKKIWIKEDEVKLEIELLNKKPDTFKETI